MRRPPWVLALLFALAVAVGFSLLGQWQIGNAVRTQAAEARDTETPRPLGNVAELAKGVTDAGAGVVVQLNGSLAVTDLNVVEPRTNAGESGAWVVGHLQTSGPDAADDAHLAVAIGWAPSVEDAEQAIERLARDPELKSSLRLEGRYMPPEAPQFPRPDEDPQALHAMVPAQLANLWDEVEGPVYSGYLVLHAGSFGDAAAQQLLDGAELDVIDSVAPLPAETVNWLNVFYALEWIVFAGFALFLWYRLARDAWEKEHELRLLEAEAAAEAAAQADAAEAGERAPRSHDHVRPPE